MRGAVFESRRPAYAASMEGAWRPQATYGLLAAMGAVYVLELAVLSRSEPLFEAVFVIGTDWPVRPWSLVTSTLSHGSVQHLLMNGLFLYFLGPAVERIVGGGRRGAVRFVLLFLAGGATSGVAQVHLEAAVSGGDAGALGASGALMMILGILVVLAPRQKVWLLFPPVPLPLWGIGLGYALLDVLGAFNPADGVGNFAHLSGVALGLGYGWWLKGDLRRRGLRLVQT